ncbi:hypothetical protein LQE92_07235 [Lacrimispora sp. NSJ-141]|uniref:Uncharacterized protein n=1 Tax=Lientehia hominis TaxID=2897778 RepID=A0AAP2RIM4_9FIRM|nr:hypothetical protein [Lientehia hominis]MCD2492426.1 hypothetical protein [Lientehia hominis]
MKCKKCLCKAWLESDWSKKDKTLYLMITLMAGFIAGMFLSPAKKKILFLRDNDWELCEDASGDDK